MYIPFEQVTVKLFHDLVERGYRHYVLQRFEWPGVAKSKGFMLSPYADEQSARVHALELYAKEGKALQLPDDAAKIGDLLQVNSGYRIFINKFSDENWNTRIRKHFQQNVINYLRTNTRFKRTDTIDVFFTIESGRVWAMISSVDTKLKVPAINIIR
ncbi:hypothetical protein [Sphingobacterium paucimobilis]|uniref:Uncharacterized protein n=1 Tax=Sphingobacterium paucimobilis HER1398 TaxID=1346330 RepID=U2HC18_9SPHI|nr:hypothetical protein [Sphingobacterium paucimobilis]ERJ59296.1 hypothetical protein M472_10975 [Sphingobacterium paucimobilis HER1398]